MGNILRLFAGAMLALALSSVPSAADPLSLTQRVALQDALQRLGYDVGGVDGILGAKTSRSIKQFQRSIGATETGELTDQQIRSLAGPRFSTNLFTRLEHQDLPQFDYRSSLSDASLAGIGVLGCEQVCEHDTRCKSYTYNIPAKACFLKSEIPSSSKFKGAISGIKTEISPSQVSSIADRRFERLIDTDLPYNDFRSGLVEGSLKGGTFEQCEQECKADARCKAYTFNTSARVCFLKNAIAAPTKFRGAISGRLIAPANLASGRWNLDSTALQRWVVETIHAYRPSGSAKVPEYPDRWYLFEQPEVLAKASNDDVHSLTWDVMPWFVAKTPSQLPSFQFAAGLHNRSEIQLPRLYFSEKHRSVINSYPVFEGKTIPDSRWLSYRSGLSYLEDLMDAVQREHGSDSPLAAYVALDITTMLNWTRHVVSKSQREVDGKKIQKLQSWAARVLNRGYSGPTQLVELFNLRAAHALASTRAYSECGADPSLDEHNRSIALALAKRIEQTAVARRWSPDLVIGAKECAPPSQALEYEELAMQLRSGAATAQDVADHFLALGTLYFQMGTLDRAKRNLVNAFSVDDGERIVPLTSATPRRVNIDHAMLATLELDEELDFLFAKELQSYANQGPPSSSVGLSWVQYIAATLEDLGRHDIADMLYAVMTTDSIGKPAVRPGTYVVILANGKVAGREYKKAIAYLERALEKTPIGVDDNLRFEYLDLLSSAHDQSGEYQLAIEFGREALVMLRQGLVDSSTGGWWPGIEDALVARLENAESEAGKAGTIAVAKVEAYYQHLSEQCLEAQYFPPLPAAFMFGDYEPSVFFEKASRLFLECTEHTFEKNVFSVPAPNLSWEVSEYESDRIENFFFVAAKLGHTETIRRTFQNLIAFAPQNFADYSSKPDFARRYYIERLASAIVGTILADEVAVARSLAETALRELDQGIWRTAVDEYSPYTPELPQLILTLKSAGLTEQFSGRGNDLLMHVRALDENYCDIQLCALNIEHMATAFPNSDLSELQDQLSNSYITYNSGAAADVVEMDAIRARAMTEAARYQLLGLNAVSKAFFDVAQASPENILKDANPLYSFQQLSAYGSLLQARYRNEDMIGTFDAAEHILRAARTRVANSNIFTGDSLLRWSSRLRGIFEVYLSSVPVDQGGDIRQEFREDAIFAIQFLQSTRTSNTLSKLAVRLSGDEEALFKAYLDVRENIDRYYGKMRNTTSTSTELLEKIKAAEAERLSLEKRLKSEIPQFHTYGSLQFSSSETLQSALQDGEGILTHYLLDDATISLFIDKDHVKIQRDRRAGRQEISQLIADYRSYMVLDDGVPNVPLGLGFNLYDLMLRPVVSNLPDLTHLIFVPHGPTDGLPVTALVTEQPSKDILLADEILDTDIPWLVRSIEITHYPSLAAVHELRSRITTKKTDGRFLGVANPTYIASKQGTILPALPETEAEIRFIAAITGADPAADLLLRTDVTKNKLLAKPLDQYDIIGFATHGFISGQIEGLDEPALALSGAADSAAAYLKMSEIASLKLNAQLVLLSACSTAASDGTPGAEGLSGLAAAFFHAGAQGLMVTHWDIPSGPAIDVSTRMIANRQSSSDGSWATALRQSVLELIDEPKSPLHAHPVSWAGQFLVATD